MGEEVALRQRLSRQLEMAKQGHERALAAVRLASTKSIGLYEVAHAALILLRACNRGHYMT